MDGETVGVGVAVRVVDIDFVNEIVGVTVRVVDIDFVTEMVGVTVDVSEIDLVQEGDLVEEGGGDWACVDTASSAAIENMILKKVRMCALSHGSKRRKGQKMMKGCCKGCGTRQWAWEPCGG